MKHLRFIAVIVVLCILCGCTEPFASANTVRFYYLSGEISYTGSAGVITPETRGNLDINAPLTRLLVQYIGGPESGSLRSPFPEGVELISTAQNGDTLILEFNDQLSTLSGIDLTLACACITKTCLELTNVVSVTVKAQGTALDGAAQITMTADSLVLLDTSGQ